MGNGIIRPPQRKPELLNCTICFNIFRDPRMLPCQHTFCETCLNTYITKTMAHTDQKTDFPCPVCREQTSPPYPQKARERWSRQFPKNRLILTLFEGEPEKSECCRTHPTKFIEFFCETHVQIGCSTCLMTKHKSCDVVPLENFVKSGKFKRSCQKNSDVLFQYRKLFEDMVVEIGKNLDALDKEKNRLITEIKSARANVETALNALEDKMVASIQENYQHECELLCEQSSRCRKVINDVMSTMEQVKAAQANTSTAQKSEIVVAVEEKLKNFGTNIREEHDKFKFVSINIVLDPLLDKVKDMEELGKLEIERSATSLPLPAFVPKSAQAEPQDVKRHRSKYVTKVSEHSMSGDNENFYCNITSSVVLEDGRLVVVDDSNCKVKLFDPKFQYVAELKLDSNPLNIAKVSDAEVAVSLPGKRQVAFISLTAETLTLGRSIPTRLDCWGLEILDSYVVVTSGRDGHSVILLDMQGKELNAFCLTVHQDENIRCPVAVIADKRQKILYVTCTGGAWSKGCVITMDLAGKLLNIYQDPDLDTPRSCALDRHGKIYICGMESSTVYQMTQSGDMFRVFPSKTEQVVGPLHLNFLKNYHIRFLVTEVASDIMKIYELPTQKYTK